MLRPRLPCALGSILLHEYTHWDHLAMPPLGARTSTYDHAYNPINTRALDKTKAIYNADSYAWFANEYFWSSTCKKLYGDPVKGDESDTNCKDNCKPRTKPPK